MSYKIYPVIQTEDICKDYQVYINGEMVELNTARVSSVPFNRRWPGHQRQIDQTELINFLSMAIDGEVEFKIIPPEKSDRVEIRPKKLGIEPKINDDGSIEFTLKKAAQFTVEPYGVSRALHIFADEITEYDVDKNDENVLYFGKGEHNIGFMEMKDDQTIFIDEGAVLYATIHATDVKNIKIIGKGILDNRYNKEEILFDINAEENDADVGNAKRLYTVEIDVCKNVLIDGITIRDPLAYNINCCSCENVAINNIKLIGDWRYNTDGVHFVNCINGRLSNSFLRTFDDSVCVRGLTDHEIDWIHSFKGYIDVCKDIVIENNVIWNDWGCCTRIGAGTVVDEIYNVIHKNCDIIHTSCRVFDAMVCDFADVHDIVYKDINVEWDDIILTPCMQNRDNEKFEDKEQNPNHVPNTICMEIIDHFEYSNDKKYNIRNLLAQIRNITFENINIMGRQNIYIGFTGFDSERMCKNIVLKNFYRNGVRLSQNEINIYHNEFCDNIKYIKE